MEALALVTGSVGLLAMGVMLGVLGAWAVRGVLRFCVQCVVWTYEGLREMFRPKT